MLDYLIHVFKNVVLPIILDIAWFYLSMYVLESVEYFMKPLVLVVLCVILALALSFYYIFVD